MYYEMLVALATYVTALNMAVSHIDEVDGLTPYVNHVPVILDNELEGFIRDEVGGAYSYREANKKEKEWWESRLWRKTP